MAGLVNEVAAFLFQPKPGGVVGLGWTSTICLAIKYLTTRATLRSGVILLQVNVILLSPYKRYHMT